MEKTLLFSVGPVEMEGYILKEGGKGLPYFRTKEYSEMMLEIEESLKRIIYTEEESKVIILTASGSGAMEAAVINIFDKKSKLLVVNGGSFGARFEKICKIHGIPHDVLYLEKGKTITREDLEKYKGIGYDGLLINVHETSTGVLHNMKMVGEFCKEQKILLVADAISSFLADEYKMDEWGIDVSILSSQKALALPPGLSMLVVNKKAEKIIKNMKVKSLYFDLKDYLVNMKRGQTPFTPAVGLTIQLLVRLKRIEEVGVDKERQKIEELAEDFRGKIKGLPFEIYSNNLSNAVTPIIPLTINAFELYEKLRYDYNISILPSGGDMRNKLVRVGHLGDLSKEDNQKLIEAIEKILNRG